VHSLEDLTGHIKTRIDDSHAPPDVQFYNKTLNYTQDFIDN
jgi:hypothetical protein